MEGKACKRHFWILVTCLFALKVTADDMTSWSVTVTPTRQKVAEGSMAIFTCKSSLPARVTFQWTKGVKPIKNRDSIEIVQIDYNRSVLKIEVVHLKKHRRSFRCTAYYEDPLSKSVLNKSANAVLKIVAKSKLPPKFPRVSSKIRKQLAESRPGMIPLFCEIEQPWSKQTPTFTWIKDSVIDLRLEKDHWESNGRMQILYVKPSQAIREYQCAVFYKRGGVAAYSNKTVADHVIAGDTNLTADNMTSWSVTVTPTRQKVAEGSMAIFTCKSSLPARVRFQWTKGVKPIKNRDSIEIVQIDYNRSVLKIDVVHLKKHRGSFRCTAYYEDPLSKSVLDKSANAVLKIVAKSKLPPKFPRVSSKIRKQLAESRPGMVPLFCEIEQPWSKQTPTFTWIKDSVIDLRLEKDHWESNDGMQILYVKPSQAIGEYQCAVFYKRGRVAAYSNKTAADVIAGDTKSCLAYNGTSVATGAWYTPRRDPCFKCRCENGNPETCHFTMCKPEPISCKNPKPDPNVCCKYICEDAQRPKDSRTCLAYNGTRVATGAWYSPEWDPCYKCRCENGNPSTCLFSSCVSPPISCKNPKFDQNVCCKYTCEEAPRPKSSRTCLAYNGTRVATGAWYSPKRDPCFECRCEHGNPGTCLSSLCMPPPISCKNPKFDRNVCCKYTCEEAPRPQSSSTCLAYNGTRVATGAWYSPERDPCFKCRCEHGNPVTCLFSSCVSPPISCKNPKFDQNVCCKYTCEEAPRPQSSRGLQMG